MARRDIIAALDIGSGSVKTVIAQIIPEEEKPRIIGVGFSPSLGVRRGMIIDLEEAVSSIRESLEKAKRSAGAEIDRAILSVGGNHISSQYSKGVIAVGRADGEVTQEDVERVIDASQAISIPPNKEILHIIPKSYSLDDQKDIKDPVGMNGVRLEVDALIIEGSTPYIKNLNKCSDQAGIDVQDVVLSPLSAAKATLSKRQKELGVALVDIGAGTTSIAVFEENELLHTAVIPLGGSHITNDIAIGLRTSIDVAENVKIEFGHALSSEIGKKEDIDLSQIDPGEEGIVSRHHVAEIIEARLEEIFGFVNKELKSIARERLLPAGAVLTGGTSKLPGIVDLAKDSLGLPSQVGFPIPLGGLIDKVDDPAFVTATGLILWQFEGLAQERLSGFSFGKKAARNLTGGINESMESVKKWLGKFLP